MRKMLCPHCEAIFLVSEDEMADNAVFTCRVCGRFNWGSSTVTEGDVLVGERFIDCDDCGGEIDSALYTIKTDLANVIPCNCGSEVWV